MSFLPLPHHHCAQPQRCLTPGPSQGSCADLKVSGLDPTRHQQHHQGQLVLAEPGTASHITGLSQCRSSNSQCVINPSRTLKPEMADSLCRHSGRDKLISLSAALPLSSFWDWIYECLALHPRQ